MMNRIVGAALQRLGAGLAGRRVVPRLPQGRVVVLPASDDDEARGAIGGEPSEPLALFIRYVDAKGDVSERRVTVRQIVGNPPAMVLAWCHERKAPRNFRLDRIAEAVCPETGEVLDHAALLQRLTDGGLHPVDPMLRRAVNALVFLMRCDGSEHPAEWEAIDQALSGFVLRFGGGDGDLARAMAMARQVAPDGDDLVIALRSFASSAASPALARWLIDAVAGVIEADGTQSEEEFAWLAEVAAFIRTMMEKAGR